MEHHERAGPSVLVVGMPRSGTTWAGKILDSHPGTRYRHEPDSEHRFEEISLAPDRDSYNRLAPRVRWHVQEMLRLRSRRVSGKLPLFAKSGDGRLGLGVRRASVLASHAAARMGVEVPIPDIAAPGARAVWKSIESLGRLGLLLHSLRDLRAIVVVRHPCGQVASRLASPLLSEPDAYLASEDYGLFAHFLATPLARERRVTLESLRQTTPVARLAWQWLLFNEKALDDARGNPRVLVVRYEDLCERPLGTARRMLEHAGLDWHPQVQSFVQASTARHDEGYFSIHKDPARTAGGWRRRLSREHIESIADIVAGTRAGRLFGLGPEGAAVPTAETTAAIADVEPA